MPETNEPRVGGMRHAVALLMGLPVERRCAIWVTSATLSAAQELADLLGIDVDTFVQFVVTQLHDHEGREGALRKRAAKMGSAPVIPLDGAHRRRGRPHSKTNARTTRGL